MAASSVPIFLITIEISADEFSNGIIGETEIFEIVKSKRRGVTEFFRPGVPLITDELSQFADESLSERNIFSSENPAALLAEYV